MSLVAYTITAIELNQADATASGKQVVVGASCSMFIQPADTIVLLYDDAAASNGSTAKTTDANGQVTVYIQPGSYRVVSNGISRYVQVGQDNAITTVGLIASTNIYPADTVINTTGFTTSADLGNGKWKQNAVTGQTASQSPAQLGNALLNDGNGNQWALVGDAVKLKSLGGIDGLDSTSAIVAFIVCDKRIKKIGVGTFTYIATTTAILMPLSSAMAGDGKFVSKFRVILPAGGAYKFLKSDSLGMIKLDSFGVDIVASTPYGAVPPSFGFFDLQPNFTAKNMHFYVDGLPTGGESYALTWAFGFGSDLAKNNINIYRVTSEGLGRLLLRGNAASNTSYNIKIKDSDSINGTAIDFDMNDPQGIIKAVVIDGVFASDNKGQDGTVPSDGFFCAFAHCEDSKLINSSFIGSAIAACHVENQQRNTVISNNTINMTSGDGIRFAAVDPSHDDPSDTIFQARKVVVSDNSFHHDSVTRADTAINIQFGTVGRRSADQLLLTDNIISNYSVGMNLNAGTGVENIKVSDNFIVGCDKGVVMPQYSCADLTRTTFEACDVAVEMSRGGILKFPTFKDNLVNISLVGTDSIACIVSPSFIFSPEQILNTFSKDYSLIENIEDIDAKITVLVSDIVVATGGIVSQASYTYTLAKTGASLTDTLLLSNTGTNTSVPTIDFLLSGTSLALRVLNSTGATVNVQLNITSQGEFYSG